MLSLSIFVLLLALRSTIASIRKADLLFWKRGLRDVEQAANIYEAALENAPDDTDLQLKLADALNTIMRIKTNGNTLVIDGLLDTDANKRVWSKYGTRALALAQKVKDQRPTDIIPAAVLADSYMFLSSTKGIISAALSGAASVFKTNAATITKLDKGYDSGVGYALTGAFYCVAPWPLGNMALAEEFMEKALSQGRSLRNHYYVGVIAYKQKKWSKAETNFKAAMNARPGSVTESDFSDFMISECKRALGLIATKTTSNGKEL